MATTERNAILTHRDESGNMTLVYPVTTVEAVDGLPEALSDMENTLASKSFTRNVTLSASGWVNESGICKQTVSVSGVTANSTVIAGGDDGSEPEYSVCEVYCSGQASGSLTFSCTYLPTMDVVANVLILN